MIDSFEIYKSKDLEEQDNKMINEGKPEISLEY